MSRLIEQGGSNMDRNRHETVDQRSADELFGQMRKDAEALLETGEKVRLPFPLILGIPITMATLGVRFNEAKYNMEVRKTVKDSAGNPVELLLYSDIAAPRKAEIQLRVQGVEEYAVLHQNHADIFIDLRYAGPKSPTRAFIRRANLADHADYDPVLKALQTPDQTT